MSNGDFVISGSELIFEISSQEAELEQLKLFKELVKQGLITNESVVKLHVIKVNWLIGLDYNISAQTDLVKKILQVARDMGWETPQLDRHLKASAKPTP